MTIPITPLSPLEQAVFAALVYVCNCSLSAHVPAEYIAKRLQPNLRGEVKKTLRKLRAKGYCIEHPTSRNTTWQLTQNGLILARTFYNF